MRRFGVLGWPVAHSRSPAMHRAAFAALGMADHSYQLLPVPPEVFDETVRALPGAGFVGANVTIPHKEAALGLADTASDGARAIGAANTLSFEPGGEIHAQNTDAPGLIAALPEPPRGRSAVVLGAGGSARAAVWALREAGAERVEVWNRTPARAAALAAEMGVVHAASINPSHFLVNCTAAGLDERSSQFKDLPVDADFIAGYACVVDLVYRAGPTELIQAATRHGCATVDGLEVLVHQGALSFTAWTGQPAPLQAMRDAASEHPTRHPTPPAGPLDRGSTGT
jgi:shikimate dehydrogenase